MENCAQLYVECGFATPSNKLNKTDSGPHKFSLEVVKNSHSN